MGVLLICGEWSQRTTLTTFTLVPRPLARDRRQARGERDRVDDRARRLPVVHVRLRQPVRPRPGWRRQPPLDGDRAGLAVPRLGHGHGLAFGAAILLSAPAIVAYLLLPTIWDAVVGGISGLSGIARWLDSAQTLSPLTQQPMSGTQWAHALTTFAVWIGIPIVIGWARIGRGDID